MVEDIPRSHEYARPAPRAKHLGPLLHVPSRFRRTHHLFVLRNAFERPPWLNMSTGSVHPLAKGLPPASLHLIQFHLIRRALLLLLLTARIHPLNSNLMIQNLTEKGLHHRPPLSLATSHPLVPLPLMPHIRSQILLTPRLQTIEIARGHRLMIAPSFASRWTQNPVHRGKP